MRIGVQTFELLLLVVALFAEEKIVAVLAHPTILTHLDFAAKTLVLFAPAHLWLKNRLHLMVFLMLPRYHIHVFLGSFKKTFLACLKKIFT